MRSCKVFAALGLALILCVFLTACGGRSKPVVPLAPVISVSSLPPGVVGAPYSATLGVVRGTGTPPFTWSITSGNLPPGLSLNSSTGAITGTPTMIGNSSFTVQVTDAKSLTASEMLSINVRGAVLITPASLPGGQVSIPYSATLTATGGVLPYSTATISGTPTTIGTSTFTIQVADAESPPATGTSAPLSIVIEGFVTITTASLPNGTVAIFYDSQLMATGGTTPYTWSLTSGALPPGLSLTPATGVISGTPTTTGSYPITVQVTDSERTPVTATAAFTIMIDPTPTLQVTTSSLLPGTQGVYYTSPLAATGGVPPYSWSLTTGSLPAGLTLSGTGVIAGTPIASGSFPITVQATDTLMNTASAGLTLTINAGPLVITTTLALPSGIQSVPYSATLGAAGGTPPYTWAVRLGTLPSGLTLNPSTGVISGTPTASGTSSIEVQVQDSESPPVIVVSKPLALVINPALTNAALTGNFAFSFSGYKVLAMMDIPVFIADRFTADGPGLITNGLLDSNSSSGPPLTSVAFTGTYSI